MLIDKLIISGSVFVISHEDTRAHRVRIVAAGISCVYAKRKLVTKSLSCMYAYSDSEELARGPPVVRECENSALRI